MKKFFGILILVLLFGCDPVHGPVIRSEFDKPIRLVVQDQEGNINEGTISPGTSVWQGGRKREIKEISVYQGDNLVFKLTEDQINWLLSQLDNKNDKINVLWKIDEKSVQLISNRKVIGEIKVVK